MPGLFSCRCNHRASGERAKSLIGFGSRFGARGKCACSQVCHCNMAGSILARLFPLHNAPVQRRPKDVTEIVVGLNGFRDGRKHIGRGIISKRHSDQALSAGIMPARQFITLADWVRLSGGR
jgi:hypothetical protein